MKSEIYKEMVCSLVNYFKSGEISPSRFRLGIEIEHFILDRYTLLTTPYHDDYGISAILKELVKNGWKPIYENDNIIGLKGRNLDISLEPGGQLELSLYPVENLVEIEKIYLEFLEEIDPILVRYNKILLAAGYQPISKIKEIELLPKKRYSFMYEYFRDKGIYAHNMMKGTASIQLNIDYSSEEDYRKKMRTAYYLSPLIYFFFDNAPFFEGKEYPNFNIRSIIWNNCDSDRCGLIDGIFDDDFGYETYAKYILDMPVIIDKKDGQLIAVGSKPAKDIIDINNFTDSSKDHILSMAFPDIRLKKYLEIRIGDSLPYPYNMSYVAFWKGLLYDLENLNYLYEKVKIYSEDDIIKIHGDIKENGIESDIYGKPLYSFMNELLKLSSQGLESHEKKYITILDSLLRENMNPKMKTLKKYNDGYTIFDSINWSIVGGDSSDVKKNIL
ncbi:MAG: glutamate--cysteine ligase [Halanaerobiaceae bacterium]